MQNVSRSTSYGMGLRVLVNGAWGFAATQRGRPGLGAQRRRAGGGHRPRQCRALTSRKVDLANADKVVTTWANPIKRDPFEVPLETKTAFLM